MLNEFGSSKSILLIKSVVLVSIVTLSSCSSIFNGQSSNSRNYALADDSVELESVDLSSLKQVVPVKEMRTEAGNKSPYSVNGETYNVMPEEAEDGYSETGLASWYGRKFHGYQTANGEIYDMFQLSAAHKTLPIPGYLNVTNLDNNKSVIVRVNDRGPFHEGRIVDLSYAAAVMLDFADVGTARVRVEAIVPDQLPPLQSLPEEILASQMESTFNSSANNPVDNNSNSADSEAVIVEQVTGAAPVMVDVSSNPATRAVQNEVSRERTVAEPNEDDEYLQIGAFVNLASAQALASQAGPLSDVPVFIQTSEVAGDLLHRVRLGPVNEIMDIQDLVQLLENAGLGRAFRVRD